VAISPDPVVLPVWDPRPAPLAQQALARYLEFIGEPAPNVPSLEALAALQRAHLLAIPFETLSPMANEPVPLDEPAIVDKLLSGARGGYCFEQNLLLAGALTALGFEAHVLAGRVLFGASEEPRPRTHAAVRVMIDGRPWLADVGFGRTAFRGPVALDDDAPQQSAGAWFRIADREGELVVLTGGSAEEPPADWEGQYVLDPRPVHRIDCEQLNLWVSTDDRAVVRQQVIVLRTLPVGRRAIRGGRLVIDEPGRHIDRELTLDELPAVLRDEFGLVAPAGIAALVR
jgi:N-hydroxyarylamine O-acetyltransferase